MEEKYLRIQLEQQRKAYEEIKKQIEKLQFTRLDAPGKGWPTAGSSGYAKLHNVTTFPGPTNKPKLDSPEPTVISTTSSLPTDVSNQLLVVRPSNEDRETYMDLNVGMFTSIMEEGKMLGELEQLRQGVMEVDEEIVEIRGRRGTKGPEFKGPAPYLVSGDLLIRALSSVVLGTYF